MATSYPGGLDTSTNLPSPSEVAFTSDPDHSVLHTTLSGAVLALEAKVGVTGATSAGTLDSKAPIVSPAFTGSASFSGAVGVTGQLTATEIAANGSGTVGRYVGTLTANPSTGTWVRGDYGIDPTILLVRVCMTGGTPGSWSSFGSASTGSPVTSVFGRTGVVVPVSGDYTYTQVGADAAGAAATAQTNSETFATTVAGTAQTNAQAFATTAASTAQSTAESFATTKANAAQSAAQAASLPITGGHLQGPVIPAVVTINAPGATPLINQSTTTVATFTGMTVNVTSFSLTGSAVDGQPLIIRFSSSTALTVAWNSVFVPSTVALPTSIVASKVLTVSFLYYGPTSQWLCVGTA